MRKVLGEDRESLCARDGDRMKPGDILSDTTGDTIVVTEGDDPVTCLLWLIQERYGGELFARDNPVVVRVAEGLKVESWRTCSVEWMEANEVTDDCIGYWAANGDGPNVIWVLSTTQNGYSLGEECEEWEVTDD